MQVIQLLAASCDFNKNNKHFFLDSIRLLQNELKCRQKKNTSRLMVIAKKKKLTTNFVKLSLNVSYQRLFRKIQFKKIGHQAYLKDMGAKLTALKPVLALIRRILSSVRGTI